MAPTSSAPAILKQDPDSDNHQFRYLRVENDTSYEVTIWTVDHVLAPGQASCAFTFETTGRVVIRLCQSNYDNFTEQNLDYPVGWNPLRVGENEPEGSLCTLERDQIAKVKMMNGRTMPNLPQILEFKSMKRGVRGYMIM